MVPCPKATLPLKTDLNRGTHGWESVILSTDPQHFLWMSFETFYRFINFLYRKEPTKIMVVIAPIRLWLPWLRHYLSVCTKVAFLLETCVI